MTVVVGGWRYRRRPEPPLVLVLVSGLMALAGVAGAVAVVVASRWDGGAGEAGDRALTDALYGLGVPWALVGAVAAVTLVRAVPDLWRRRVVEGAVVRRQVAYGEDAVEGYRQFLAVDDGRSDTLVAYPLGRERRTRIGTSPYHHVQTGDVVRLTVAPGYGHVFRIEPVHDAEGRPLPPLGMLPATPAGAPVTVEDVGRLTRYVVRRVGEATTTHEGTVVRSWRFDLVDEKGLFVAVHVARGDRADDAIAAVVGPDGGVRSVRRGPVTVGVQRALLTGLPRGSSRWDQELAALALANLDEPIE